MLNRIIAGCKERESLVNVYDMFCFDTSWTSRLSIPLIYCHRWSTNTHGRWWKLIDFQLFNWNPKPSRRFDWKSSSFLALFVYPRKKSRLKRVRPRSENRMWNEKRPLEWTLRLFTFYNVFWSHRILRRAKRKQKSDRELDLEWIYGQWNFLIHETFFFFLRCCCLIRLNFVESTNFGC